MPVSLFSSYPVFPDVGQLFGPELIHPVSFDSDSQLRVRCRGFTWRLACVLCAGVPAVTGSGFAVHESRRTCPETRRAAV